MKHLTKTIVFLFLIFFLISWASFVFAKVTLEVSYPETIGKELTATTTLPAVIKYFFYFFIIIAVLLTVFSLIYGGILYLGSTGSPAAMAGARKRILGSLAGLAILLASYLLLQTLNPQLTILRVKRVPVETGVLLLNDTAYMEYKGKTIPEDKIQELLDAPAGQSQAVYLSFDMYNLQEEFGEFQGEDRGKYTPQEKCRNGKWEDPDDKKVKCNFANFKLEGIYFLPNSNTKVFTYYSPGFMGPMLSGQGGDVDFSGGASPKYTHPENEYYYYDCSAGKGPCKLRLIDKLYMVPMSIRVKGIGKGVYLYSDELGGELYLQSSVDNFDSLHFDDKAKRIEIRNTVTTWGFPEKSRFIVTLHDNAHYEGKLRLFFEKFTSSVFELTGAPVGEVGNLPEDVGNTPENEAFLEDFNDKVDEYGKVNKASSAHIFQLDEAEKSCREVRLCTGPSLSGDCLSYRVTGGPAPSEVDNIVYSDILPIYRPKNVPQQPVDVDDDDDGTPDREVKFNNNIRSMKIRGECLVALFENSVKTVSPFWEGGEPGGHSQVFFAEQTYPDFINKEEIGRCGSFLSNIGWGERESCVSAIAIYPVKGTGSSVSSPAISSPVSFLNPNIQLKHPGQAGDASPALVELANCIYGKYSGLYITSISDSAGMDTCQGDNWSQPPCAHTQYSCHYGGRNATCQGKSYAIDTPRDDGIKNAAKACAEDPIEGGYTVHFKDEVDLNHYHFSVGNCGCDTHLGTL